MANTTAAPVRAMRFDSRQSCIITWPNGEPSLAHLTRSFERLGLRPSTHRPSTVGNDARGSVHAFTFEPVPFSNSALAMMADAFNSSIIGDTHLDIYSRLIGAAEITWRSAGLVRAICRFLVQTRIGFSESYIVDTLAGNADFITSLIDLFHARFDPSAIERAPTASVALAAVDAHIDATQTLDQDRILRALRSFVLATLRTNWFQLDKDGRAKTYSAFKLDSRMLTAPGQIVPHREIYVHARHVEGVHLRGALIARGGLRWSDRPEDYRTEALSLMKTQGVKNAPIVPGGAKGAFVTLNSGSSRVDRETASVAGYSTFIRGLLDVTDNIVDGQLVRMPDTVAYDGGDAYLVVAADKGTAQFSDIANSIADEYGYWLGDAFASGGSKGYDHKAMGITARGAWVAVKRHFFERGLDVATDDFTVVGIGDMSGDVFGNGMLLSEHIKLIAAFDHRHIFIDPDPNPASSFAERTRLAALPRSSWADYNRAVLSAGGQVVDRTAKMVKIDAAAAVSLGLDNSTTILTPNELIRVILSSPVDLLWNGGVGTFVKASDESDVDAADPSNDAIRVDAAALRVAVVGEGGNLGFTQRARVEFASRGGRINADFIDNAAGVATSDLEVNIKIALAGLQKADPQRWNTVLISATEGIAESVLRASADQTLAISVAERRAPSLLDQHDRLIEDLCTTGVLNRADDIVPTAKVLAARSSSGMGLLRPELAVLVAQSKNTIAAELLASDVPDNPAFSARLLEYFPEPVRSAAGGELGSHRLAREIIAASLADEVVNRLGPGVFYRLEERLGVKSPQAILAYEFVTAALEVENLRERIVDSNRPAIEVLDLLVKLQLLVESEMSWVLRNPAMSRRLATHPVADIIQWRDLVSELHSTESTPETISRLFGALGFVAAAIAGGTPVTRIAGAYCELGEKLGLLDELSSTDDAGLSSHWEMRGLAAVRARIRDRFLDLVMQILNEYPNAAKPVQIWTGTHADSVTRFALLMARVSRGEPLDVARLSTLEAELELMLR